MRRSLLPAFVVATTWLGLAQPLAAQGATYEQLQTFSYLLGQIRLNYVRPVNTSDLVRAAIDGVLRSLDPHSRFVTREQNDRWLAWEAGRLGGTGIVVDDEDGATGVAAVLPGSPAARAGVWPGDVLLAIDDTLVAGSSTAQVQDKLLGDKGRTFRLRLARGSRLDPDTLTVDVTADILRPQSVSQARRLPSGIGYIQLAEFETQAGREVREAAQRILAGQQVRRLVLDLRGNPGGAVTAAVDVASVFLPKGTVVFRTEGRRPGVNRVYTTSDSGGVVFADVPLVVLIDRYTASAAEALAGALQDHDRAEILGQRSFGKALEQQLYEVPPNGDAVWLTVGYVHTPSGRLIQRRFRGLSREQYFALAGHPGAAADTTGTYRTDGGRTVRGGGGIEPDSVLSIPGPPPPWWSVAADSGFAYAVADSVAHTLGPNPASWMDDAPGWKARLLAPFLSRVSSRLHVSIQADSARDAALALYLATRAVEVHWGIDIAEQFLLHNDAEVRAAEEWLQRPGAGPTVVSR